ncbi:site-specific DNA-methyltransferase [Acidimicrobiaceae bacterium]|jgi:site-specific DNA-methyltransferase (adenine-specific)|nr:site-specific DNA-methyltransferase [Candidatus Actinomarina sp.]MDC0058319.1 site-specific DNA-methyltransferase [Acidimicrobiaceae bacterium]NND23221.1 site-specific DNA-methyltransferase [Acidimicrobiia bacterium]|tara:strand:+ start:1726 stop:2556 length:831 start_codon:yes stop_codon:yes gene_type:complete
MSKKSVFETGMGSRKGYVSKFQTDMSKTDVEKNKKTNKKNIIFNKSAEKMDDLIDNCVSLTVTSPPYNVGKLSDNNLSDEDYWKLMRQCFKEVYRVTESGGRLVLNVANLGRKPYIPFSNMFTDLMLDLGFLMRGEIIWQKSKGANANFAWGSWLSASNPVIRDIHEYCLVFSKEGMSKGSKGKSTIEKDEFMESTLSIWNINPARAKKIGHPAPFPVELAERFINLYSYEKDLILDPFIGSGTTALAASKLKRSYIGYEVNAEYCKLAEKRLAED